MKQIALSNIERVRIKKRSKHLYHQQNVPRGVLEDFYYWLFQRLMIYPQVRPVINQKIKKIVSDELVSLNNRYKVLEEKIEKQEKQTKKLMKIENRFQELAIDVSKKKLIFEGLKDQLKEKILTAGLDNIQQPVLLTKAVPPFNKHSPNKKSIVVLEHFLSHVFRYCI